MSIEAQIIDLLYWTRNLLRPEGKPYDRYLNPFTNKLARKDQMRQHQVDRSLWIPTLEGVAPKMPGIQRGEVEGFTVFTYEDHFGAGVGESEALLSLLQDVRTRNLAA